MQMLRRKIDDFYLMKQIGSGGMSEVFLGINPKTHEKRAFKILNKCASLNPATYARFLREIDIIRGLAHPGIIRIIDNGILQECYYYSMDYMPGGNLNRHLERGKIALGKALELFVPICAGMAYAHENGVIHRDLKPSNILLDKSGNPVVSDFGIAKMLNYEKAAITKSGEILGTIAYLAPEQRFSSKNVNRRADVYALGTILYEMLMGFPPLGKFPRPTEIQSDFPEHLQTILDKCLIIDPECRFAHAGLLLSEMKEFMELSDSGGNAAYFNSAALKYASRIKTDLEVPTTKTDRIESWFHILRTGTTRERLSIVREMAEKLSASEAKAVVKIYPEEGDRVRWGLIRVFGELKIKAGIPLILSDLRNPYHTECAIEALGKIGSEDAYNAILEFIGEHPESAIIALIPLARTGKQRAVKYLKSYLSHEMATLRQTAVQALATIQSAEALQTLKDHLSLEHDERVRSSLLRAVRSLQGIVLPDITVIKKTENLLVVRNGQ